MKLAYFPNHIAKNAHTVLDAFLTGCRRVNITPSESDKHADAAVIWSQLWAGRMAANRDIWQHFRKHNRPVVVLEVGGLIRGHTWRIGLNGVNRQGVYWNQGNDAARAQKLGIRLEPWSPGGQHIMICLQRSESEQWRGLPPVDKWLTSIVHTLRQHTDRPIVVRSHPRQKISLSVDQIKMMVPQKLINTYDCFDFDPRGSWAVINWSSNPAMQSVIQGVPAFVGPDSLAMPVSAGDLSSIESPARPDRQQWLNDLCYAEWTVDEIMAGIPQAMLKQSMLTHPHSAFV